MGVKINGWLESWGLFAAGVFFALLSVAVLVDFILALSLGWEGRDMEMGLPVSMTFLVVSLVLFAAWRHFRRGS